MASGNHRTIVALLAHKTLAQQLNFKAVLTTELKNVDGNSVGAWLFAGNRELIDGERFRNFVRAASPRVATALWMVDRSEQGIAAQNQTEGHI